MAFDQVSFSLNITASEPTEIDLRMLVAKEISGYHDLGTMLGLKFRQVEMFKKEQGGDMVLINMKILTTWIAEETKMPTTWLTLVQALHDMGMKKLAHNIIEKLEQRLKLS